MGRVLQILFIKFSYMTRDELLTFEKKPVKLNFYDKAGHPMEIHGRIRVNDTNIYLNSFGTYANLPVPFEMVQAVTPIDIELPEGEALL